MSDESDERYIISKKEIEEFEGIDKTHFLNNNARRVNKSLSDLTGLKQIGFHIIEIKPEADSTEFHSHCFEEECLYILQGEATARIGNDSFIVREGDFIGYRANGKAHQLTNTGDGLLKCIVVGQRLDHDVADYPDKAKRLFRNKGMPWQLVDMIDIEQPKGGKK